jgi:hypothetical protein
MALNRLKLATEGIPPEVLGGNSLAPGLICWRGQRRHNLWDTIYQDFYNHYKIIIQESQANFTKEQLKRFYKSHYRKAFTIWESIPGITEVDILKFIDYPLVVATDVPSEVYAALSTSIKIIINITSAAIVQSTVNPGTGFPS